MTVFEDTFTVTYSDGSSVIVKPVKWSLIGDLEILLQELLVDFIDVNFAPGSLIGNKNSRDKISKIAAILPVVGSETPGLDLDRIESLEDIIRIFVTASAKRDPSTGSYIPTEGIGFLPSEVSRINGLNFYGILQKSQDEVKAKYEEANLVTKRTKK